MKKLEAVCWGVGVGGKDTSIGGVLLFLSGVVHCQITFVFYYNDYFFWPLLKCDRHTRGATLGVFSCVCDGVTGVHTHTHTRGYSLVNVVGGFGQSASFGLCVEAHHVHEVVGRSRTAARVHLAGSSLDNTQKTEE